MSDRNKNETITIEAPVIPEEEQRISYNVYKKTLTSMGISVAKQERIQSRKSRINELWTRGVSYPSMIFSALVVFSGFAQFSRHSQDPACSPDLWLQILSTIFGLLTLGFSVTRDFFKFETKKINHDKGSKALRAFFYTIDTYRNINPKYGDRLSIINELKNKLDNIMRDNPSISSELAMLDFSATPPESVSEESSSESDINTTRTTSSQQQLADDINRNYLRHYSSTDLNLKYNMERLSSV